MNLKRTKTFTAELNVTFSKLLNVQLFSDSLVMNLAAKFTAETINVLIQLELVFNQSSKLTPNNRSTVPGP